MTVDDYLDVAFCSHEAARFAVEHWHYAGVLPTGKLVKIGVWERGEFVGAVVFSRGASPWLGDRLDLDHTEVCELTRIALRRHDAPVSAVISRAVALLRTVAPGLRAVVSFADPTEGHHGGVYQAAGWVYTGRSSDVVERWVGGRWRHTRGSYWESKATNAPLRIRPGKHRYILSLDRPMRRRVRRDAQPYPQPLR